MVVLNVENSKTTKFWRMSVCTNSDGSMLFANALCPLPFTKSGSNISDTRKSVSSSYIWFRHPWFLSPRPIYSTRSTWEAWPAFQTRSIFVTWKTQYLCEESFSQTGSRTLDFRIGRPACLSPGDPPPNVTIGRVECSRESVCLTKERESEREREVEWERERERERGKDGSKRNR